MKKQLGLLTLGMALCLVAPVVGQAADGEESYPKSDITVNVSSDMEKEIKVEEAPDVGFELKSTENPVINQTGEINKALVVRNTDSSATWRVQLYSTDIVDKNSEKLKDVVVNLPIGDITSTHNSGLDGLERESWNSTEGGKVVFKHKKPGTTGLFTHSIGVPTISMAAMQPAGEYTSKMTWLLIPNEEM